MDDSWFIKSYLSDRTFRIQTKQDISIEGTIQKAVPQSCILGPLPFNIYTTILCCTHTIDVQTQ